MSSSIPESQSRLPIQALGGHALGLEQPTLLGQQVEQRRGIPGPARPRTRRRSQEARAGLRPLVEKVASIGPRRTTAGRMKRQWSGSSAALTSTPSARRRGTPAPSTSGSPVAAMTRR